MNRKVIEASEASKTFLLPPYESPTARADALAGAASLIRQAIELSIRGGRDDLAFRLLDIAQELEA